MAVGALGPIVITDSSIYRTPFGLVPRWMTKMAIRFKAETIKAAPMRTGRLKAGIDASTRKVGPKQIQLIGSSSAKHTMYVLKGTHGPIMSNALWDANGVAEYRMVWRNGRMVPAANPGSHMAVGRNPWPPVTPREIVKGQRANNFMERGLRATARYHRSIRGISFPDL